MGFYLTITLIFIDFGNINCMANKISILRFQNMFNLLNFKKFFSFTLFLSTATVSFANEGFDDWYQYFGDESADMGEMYDQYQEYIDITTGVEEEIIIEIEEENNINVPVKIEEKLSLPVETTPIIVPDKDEKKTENTVTEKIAWTASSDHQATTTVVGQLQTLARENDKEYLGFHFYVPDLPTKADIVSAKLQFKNAKSGERIYNSMHFYAEKSCYSMPFDLKTMPSTRDLTTEFDLFRAHSQWEKDQKWSQNVTSSVKALFNAGLGGQHIVLIAKGLRTELLKNTFFNYTLNENVVELVITFADETSDDEITPINSCLLQQINAIDELQTTPFTQIGDFLESEIDGVKTVVVVKDIEKTEDLTAGIYTDKTGQMILTTANGYKITTHAVIQNMPDFKTALKTFGYAKTRITEMGMIEVVLNGKLYRVRPDASTMPVENIATGIHITETATFFVFVDELGQLRQQILYVDSF